MLSLEKNVAFNHTRYEIHQEYNTAQGLHAQGNNETNQKMALICIEYLRWITWVEQKVVKLVAQMRCGFKVAYNMDSITFIFSKTFDSPPY